MRPPGRRLCQLPTVVTTLSTSSAPGHKVLVFWLRERIERNKEKGLSIEAKRSHEEEVSEKRLSGDVRRRRSVVSIVFGVGWSFGAGEREGGFPTSVGPALSCQANDLLYVAYAIRKCETFLPPLILDCLLYTLRTFSTFTTFTNS